MANNKLKESEKADSIPEEIGQGVFKALYEKDEAFLKDMIKNNPIYTYRAFALLGYASQLHPEKNFSAFFVELASELHLSNEEVEKILIALQEATDKGIFGIK